MSKKRVHEIAKELKDNHGIELDNKAVVTELQSLGYDVKSHSSSLEDDQAVAAVARIVDKRKPKAAPPPLAPKGFVVRRKVGDSTVQTAQAAPPAGQVISKPVIVPPGAVAVAEVEAPTSAPAIEAAAAPDEAAAAPVSMPAATMVETPAVVPPAAVAAATEVSAAVASAPTPVPAAAAVASAPRARASVAAPRVSAPPAAAPAMVVPPSAVPPMVRQGFGARASAPRPGVTIRPQLGGVGATATGLATPAVPRPTMPTATQAVLVSRPLIAIKRVTPTHQPNRYPMAPGKKAIGEVREFKVVPNQFGAGAKDFIDVSKAKEKERKGSGRTAKDKTTECEYTQARIKAVQHKHQCY